jgi:hypothetical protein
MTTKKKKTDKKEEKPELKANPALCFIGPNNKFRAISPFLDFVDPELVFVSNRDLLISFGCESEQQIKDGYEFLLSFSLDSTFNSWENDDEGTSGISSKGVMSNDLTIGALIALKGLLQAHPDARPSGTLTFNYSNPKRGLRR